MEGKNFEEGLAEIRLQSTLLFHQTKLTESFRQVCQDFSLARRDISLVTEKLHRSIKASIKEEDGQGEEDWDTGTGYSLKDKDKAKTEKTEHGFGKSAKN
ncbi:hypothetical protein Tco_0741965 [Tanacetum coccineum]